MSAKCQNHPNAPAIELCTKCSSPLCGMCASFTDDGVFCEPCADIHETNKSVAMESAKLERKSNPVELQPEPEVTSVPIRAKHSNTQVIPITITVICVGIIATRFIFFSTPGFVPLDEETRAQQLSITPFQECVRIFEEIGRILARGGTPPETLTCDASGQSNIVSRVGNNVIVEHPQPDFYGYSRIYVSRNSPEPTLLQ